MASIVPAFRPRNSPRSETQGSFQPFYRPGASVSLEAVYVWMESDSVYFFRRARQERDAAREAVHPDARQAHLAMARHFETLSEAIAAKEKQWGAC